MEKLKIQYVFLKNNAAKMHWIHTSEKTITTFKSLSNCNSVILTALQSLLCQPKNQRSLKKTLSQHDGSKKSTGGNQLINRKLVFKAPQPDMMSFIYFVLWYTPTDQSCPHVWLGKAKVPFWSISISRQCTNTHRHTRDSYIFCKSL